MKQIFVLSSTVLKGHQKDLEEVVGAGDKLVKLNNLKGKISQKVSGICQRSISSLPKIRFAPPVLRLLKREFRLNRITDAQNKAKELEKVFGNLRSTIKLEQERERQFADLS
jgi:hypothetical protein